MKTTYLLLVAGIQLSVWSLLASTGVNSGVISQETLEILGLSLAGVSLIGGIKGFLMYRKLRKQIKKAGGEKSQLVALILCIFVGYLGIHRFYLGYTWQGIVQLLTGGLCGIWSLIDLIRIITGDLKPKDGEYAKTL